MFIFCLFDLNYSLQEEENSAEMKIVGGMNYCCDWIDSCIFET